MFSNHDNWQLLTRLLPRWSTMSTAYPFTESPVPAKTLIQGHCLLGHIFMPASHQLVTLYIQTVYVSCSLLVPQSSSTSEAICSSAKMMCRMSQKFLCIYTTCDKTASFLVLRPTWLVACGGAISNIFCNLSTRKISINRQGIYSLSQ
jgi:hypothetical protein